MHFTVELGFDVGSQDHIRGIWRLVREEFGAFDGPDITGQPHITLTLFPDWTPPKLKGDLDQLAKQFSPFDIELSSVESFPSSEGVVYLAPKPSQELLAVHATFHRALAERDIEGHPYYRPGEWVPHCGLAMGVPKNLIDAVIEQCQAVAPTQATRVETVAGVEYRPARELYRVAFVG